MANFIERCISETLRPFPGLRVAVRRTYQRVVLGLDSIRGTSQAEPEKLCRAQAISEKGAHCFFGYYETSPWDLSEQHLVYLKNSFADRMPQPGETIKVCVVEPGGDTGPRELAETSAWCWQQGCMLQWLGGAEGVFAYNDAHSDSYVCHISDLNGKTRRTLPRAAYSFSKDGAQALSLDFARLAYAGAGYGYVALPFLRVDDRRPGDDGIWLIDTATGRARLVVSLDQVARITPRPEFDRAFHYFNLLLFNPSGSRFVFLHHWFAQKGARIHTRLYTAAADGSEFCLLADHGIVSHFTWRDDQHLLAWVDLPKTGLRYHLFEDQTNKVEVIGKGILNIDGHPSYSPDGRWLLTDTYPSARRRQALILFDTQEGRRYDLGSYFAPLSYDGPLRCDLHPRWSPSGRYVCFDSVHEGERRVYVAEVADLLKSLANKA